MVSVCTFKAPDWLISLLFVFFLYRCHRECNKSFVCVFEVCCMVQVYVCVQVLLKNKKNVASEVACFVQSQSVSVYVFGCGTATGIIVPVKLALVGGCLCWLITAWKLATDNSIGAVWQHMMPGRSITNLSSVRVVAVATAASAPAKLFCHWLRAPQSTAACAGKTTATSALQTGRCVWVCVGGALYRMDLNRC